MNKIFFFILAIIWSHDFILPMITGADIDEKTISVHHENEKIRITAHLKNLKESKYASRIVQVAQAPIHFYNYQGNIDNYEENGTLKNSESLNEPGFVFLLLLQLFNDRETKS